MSRSLRNTVAVLVAAMAGATLVPSASAAAPAPAGCSLGTVQPDSEAAPSCVAADVTLDRLPAVGESATVRVRLRSQVAIGRAKLTVRLPATLRLTPAGSALSAPRQAGLSQVSEAVFALSTSGRTVTFGVTALAAGPAQIEADVTDLDANDPERSGHGWSLLTVGDRPGGSHAGVAGQHSRAVAVPGSAPHTARPSGAGQICVSGGFTVADAAGTWLPGRYVPVAVLGKTTASGRAQTYASGLTSAGDGSYALCFAAPVTPMYSVWVQFTSASAVWQVTDNRGRTPYTVTTAPHYTVPAGSTQDFGSVAPAAIHMRGWHAFYAESLLWDWRSSGTACWTRRQTSDCSRISLHWEPGSTDGTYYRTGTSEAGRYVALTDADPDSEHLVLHESGHALQHMLWGFWWPASDCPSPHYLHKRSGAMCAWTEGFANAVTGFVKGDGRFYWPNGAWMDLMNTTPYDPTQPEGRTNVANGDLAECRVAGSLIDLWRQVDGGPAGTFDNLSRYTSTTFREWFDDDRPLTGLDTSATTRDLLWSHTIDYRPDPPGTIVPNGRFEDGPVKWAITGGVVGNWVPYAAQQGSWYAWMGGNGTTNTDTLAQQITVPSGAASATLGLELRIASQDTGTAAHDTLQLQVIDGTITTTLGTWSNADAGSWYVHRSFDVGAYRGKTVTLRFVSAEDAGLQTDFLIDAVAVTTT